MYSRVPPTNDAGTQRHRVAVRNHRLYLSSRRSLVQIGAVDDVTELRRFKAFYGLMQNLAVRAAFHDFKAFDSRSVAASRTRRVGVNDVAPAQRRHVGADYEVVPLGDGDGRVQFQLRPSRIAGLGAVIFQQAQTRNRLAGSGVDGDVHIVAQRIRRVSEDSQADVERRCGTQPAGNRQRLAARNVALGNADEVSGDSRAGFGFGHALHMRLQAANPRLLSGDC